MRPLLFAALTATLLLSPASAQQRREPTPQEKQEQFSRAFVMGLELLTARNVEAAERAFKACIQLFPDRPVAYYNLACTYSVANKPVEAVEALRECFKRGYRDLAHMSRDMDLDGIRKSPAYRLAMNDFADEIKRGSQPAIVDEPAGASSYPVLVWIHDVGVDPTSTLGDLRKALPKWGLILPRGAAQNPQASDSSGEFRILSAVREALDGLPKADRQRVFLVGEGIAGHLVVGTSAHNPDLFAGVLAAGPALGAKIDDVDLSGTRAYLVVHASDPNQTAAGEEARDAYARAGSAVVLERYLVANPLTKDRAVLLRALTWLQGNPVSLPGVGRGEEF